MYEDSYEASYTRERLELLMKIKTVEKSYEEVLALPTPAHPKPKKQKAFWRFLLKTFSAGELKTVNFSHTTKNMEKIKQDEPCLYLMNHSSFIDLKIASTLIYPKPFHIICTMDALVGKEKLMRNLGCIPTRKFVMDVNLVRDMIYAVNKLNGSLLLYPEAGYSFDGTATPLGEGLGKCIKMLGIPVVMIQTTGAFLRDPLYNCLQLRQVNVSADMECILTKEEIENQTVNEINELVKKCFSFDQFCRQQEKQTYIAEGFRADGLHRVLYKCPQCHTDGQMIGQGITLSCKNCGKEYTLTDQGYMKAQSGQTEFAHIPDWYKWERECVREEIQNGFYKLDIPVQIGILKDTKALYMVGEGRLVHNKEGFHLTGCDGKLDYHQSSTASYTLNSDYFWYEIGDVINIGDAKMLYYCFVNQEDNVVAKTRLATEEIYKIVQHNEL